MTKDTDDKKQWDFSPENSDGAEDGGDAGGAGGTGGPSKPPIIETGDTHASLFHEASTRGKLRANEAEFGKVLAETNIDVIFAQLLAKLNTNDQTAALEAINDLAAHPLLSDSQMFDGMENDLNLNPDAVTDPDQKRELKNRLEQKLQQKLQQKLRMSAPRPTNF